MESNSINADTNSKTLEQTRNDNSNNDNNVNNEDKSEEKIIQVKKDNGYDITELEIMANQKSIKGNNKTTTKSYSSSEKSEKRKDTYNEQTSVLYEKKLLKLAQQENEDPSIRIKKSKLVFKLEKIGIHKTMNNTLEQLEFEFEKNSYDKRMRARTELFKDVYVGLVGFIEYANKKRNPFGIDLDGWQTSVKYEVKNVKYEEAFYELAEKYDGAFPEVGPELTLIGMTGFSAFTFARFKESEKERVNPQNIPVNETTNINTNIDFEEEIELQPPPTFIIEEMCNKMKDREEMKKEIIIIGDEQKKKRGRPRKN